jgi:hypothetical protein
MTQEEFEQLIDNLIKGTKAGELYWCNIIGKDGFQTTGYYTRYQGEKVYIDFVYYPGTTVCVYSDIIPLNGKVSLLFNCEMSHKINYLFDIIRLISISSVFDLLSCGKVTWNDGDNNQNAI